MNNIHKLLYIDGVLYSTTRFSDKAFEDLKTKAQALLVFEDLQWICSENYTEDTDLLSHVYSLYEKGDYTHLYKNIIIYHANCSDGLAAAAVAKSQYEDAVLIPGTYGFPKFNFKDCYIYFVDFSYKKDDMEVLLKNNTAVWLIDHHKSAIEDTEPLMEEYDNFFPYISENNTNSGVGLAWNFFYNPNELPYAYQLIQDRDLWTWKLDGKAALKAIDLFYPRTVESYMELGKLSKEEVVALGARGVDLITLEDNLEEQMIKDSSRYIDIFGYTDIPCLNVHGAFVSNIGNKIMLKYPATPFVLLWQVTKKGIKVSIRSTDENEDGSKIAQMFAPNGGGHHNAAGVLIPFDSPYVQTLLGL